MKDPSSQGGTLVVSRNGDRRETRTVVVEAIRHAPKLRARGGGDRRPFPEPMVVVSVDCAEIPDVATFGRSCGHGAAPHGLDVAVEPSVTDVRVYAPLWAAAVSRAMKAADNQRRHEARSRRRSRRAGTVLR